MKIYTRKGDSGGTSLAGGIRVDKDHIRIRCMGEMDEANSRIGHLRSRLPLDHGWQEPLKRIQVELMDMMSHLARPEGSASPNPNPLPADGPAFCEGWIDTMEGEMGVSDSFLLPGGTEISALCHLVRTAIRTAERTLSTLAKAETVPGEIMAYINRLSDLFFVLARYEMFCSKSDEERWNLFRYKKRGSQKTGE